MEKKEEALDAAVSQIERQFGKGAIMKMGDASPVDIDVVSTGALSLDLALGIGGLPRGRGPAQPAARQADAALDR